MNRVICFQKTVTCIVLMAFSFVCLFVAPVQAAMVGTADLLSEQQKDVERQKVKLFLQRQDVVQHLQAWGVSPEEALARVDTMTDEEVATLSGKIDQMPAGGDFITFIAVVALVTLIVFIITDIMGVTDVFTFIKKR